MVARYKALLIGNSRFALDATLPNLEGPATDVGALRGALTDPEVGLFAPADVRVVPERGAQEILVEVQQFLDSATRDDLLLLYYSGHGVLDNRNQLFFCAADTRTNLLKATSVGSTAISSMIADSAARTTLIVLDCCHSGAFKGVDLSASLAGTGRFVLASCRGSELANDTNTRNGTSLFTTYLVEALVSGGSNADGDGYVDLDELYAVLHRRLDELTPRRPLPQRDFAGVGDVAIARRPGSRSVGTPPAGTPPIGTLAAGTRGRRAGWWRIPAAIGAAVVLAAAVIALVASGLPPVVPGCAPGDLTPLGSGTVAAADQRCPGEGVAQPSTRAARAFSADGTPVEGAPAAVHAQVLEPGTYSDTLLLNETSWYAVELEVGEELVATVTRAGLPAVQARSQSYPPYLEVFFADPDFNEANSDSDVGYVHKSSVITIAQSIRIRTGVVGVDGSPPTSSDVLRPGTYAVRVLQEEGFVYDGASNSYVRSNFPDREIPVELTFDVQRSEGAASPSPSPSPATEEPAVIGLLSGLAVLMAVSLTVLLRGVRRAAPASAPLPARAGPAVHRASLRPSDRG